MLRARDIMSRSVVSIGPNNSVLEAAKLMVENRISAVPVIDGSRLVGILSEGDLVHRQEIGTAGHRRSWWLRLFQDPAALAEEYARSHSRHVFDVMSQTVHAVDELASVSEVAELLDRKKIKRVPVTADGTLVGIISRFDLIRAFVASAVQETFRSADSDLAIRTKLWNELRDQPWATTAGLNLQVIDGRVTLSGCIGSEYERMATRVLAENISGVRVIEDHRIIIDYPDVTL